MGYVSETFTIFQLIFRSLFTFVSFVAFILYLCSCCKFKFSELSFESQHTFYLSLSLILFNNPFYFLFIFWPSLGWKVFNAIIGAQFVAFCLYFWLAVFEKYKEYDKCNWLRWLKFGFTLVFFILLSVFDAFVTNEFKHNPNYFIQDNSIYYGVFIGILVLISIYLIWSIVLAVRACIALKKAIKSNRVNSRFQAILLISLACLMLAIFGIFVGAFEPIAKRGALNLMYFSMFNLYVYMLQWLCSPSTAPIDL